jgi:uncharacterized protein with PQ loop repeat
MEAIGWIGGLLLATCVVPQVIDCLRKGHAEGIDKFMLWMWGSGELLMVVYVWPTGKLPLLVNYLVNFLLLLVIVWFKICPRRIGT